jgi:hypothetical protein
MTTSALTHDAIKAQGGLPLIVKLLVEKFSGLRRAFGSDPERSCDRLSDADILISQLGLLVQGRSHHVDIELFRSLSLPFVPSESIPRQHLKALANVPSRQRTTRRGHPRPHQAPRPRHLHVQGRA